MNIDLLDIAKTLTVLPRVMHHIRDTFKPKLDIPIKKNEAKTLMMIHHKPNMPIKYYLDIVGLESGSFTYVIDKLVDKNLIIREKSSEDMRMYILTLTEKGKELTNKMEEEFSNHIANTLEGLSDESLEKIKQATNLLEDVLEELLENEKGGK